MFKKEKFPLTLFVAASFLALIMFFLFLVIISLDLRSTPVSEKNPETKKAAKTKYYFKEDFNEDPLITETPSWNNLLAGPIISSVDPSLGEDDATVSMVVFSDFVCSYCSEQESVYKKLLEEYGDRVKFIWKDYPENDVDSVSFQASIAARCAQEQDSFWPYHDLLYANNENLGEETYYVLAEKLGLDLDSFKDCFKNKKTINLIIDNMKEAEALEITGIPFIYINDQELMGQVSYDNLKNIIDVQLKKGE